MDKVSTSDLDKIGKFLVTQLATELTTQKHDSTGEGIRSLKSESFVFENYWEIGIFMNDYLEYVNRGRDAGGKRVPLDVLIKWVKDKAIAQGDNEIRSIAFAIQNKIWQEGIPTVKSRALAVRRTGFVDYVLDNHVEQILLQVAEVGLKNTSVILDNILEPLRN